MRYNGIGRGVLGQGGAPQKESLDEDGAFLVVLRVGGHKGIGSQLC